MPNELVLMLAAETMSEVLGETSLRSTSSKGLPYLEKRPRLTLEDVKKLQ